MLCAWLIPVARGFRVNIAPLTLTRKSLGELRRRQVLWDASRAERVQKELLKELLKRHQARPKKYHNISDLIKHVVF